MQEEEKFLESYSTEDYPRPSVTADIVVFKPHGNEKDRYYIRRIIRVADIPQWPGRY